MIILAAAVGMGVGTAAAPVTDIPTLPLTGAGR